MRDYIQKVRYTSDDKAPSLWKDLSFTMCSPDAGFTIAVSPLDIFCGATATLRLWTLQGPHSQVE
jgi:hypothetical protein